jgi:hypothetical protein
MIIIECENDVALLFRMGFTSDQIYEYEVHKGGRSRVLQLVDEILKPTITIIGIIDQDIKVRLPSELKQYKIQKDSTKFVKLMKRIDNENKRLIMICPNLEHWLYEVAKRKKILPSKFKLPEDPKRLHDDGSEETEKNFREFLVAVIKKKDRDIIKMKQWIQEAIQ